VVRVALAVVHDLREARAPAGPDELAAFETDTLAGLVLAGPPRAWPTAPSPAR
jgi:hypothetical protein